MSASVRRQRGFRRALSRGLACAVALVAAGLIGSCGHEADGGTSDSSQRVVVYVSVDDVIARPILDVFEKETGIKVEMRSDTEATKNTGLVQRLRAEKERPRADVFWSSEVFLTIRLAREGLLRPFDDPEVADWPERLRDKDGLWYAFAQRARVIAYNTKRLRPEDAPHQMLELSDPRFRSRIVIARPQFGTTRGHMAALETLWGDDTMRWWLEQVRDNGLRLVDGNTTVVRMIAKGEADVGLADTDDIWMAQRQGWPVGYTFAEQSGSHADRPTAGSVLTIPNAVSLIKGGPHPENAEKLAAFLLSERVERMLAESDSHNMPIRPALAAEFPQYVVPDPLEIPYDEIADHMDAAMRACDEVLH